MSTAASLFDELSEDAVWRLEAACCRFEAAWQSGGRPAPKDYLDSTYGAERVALLRELLRMDVFYRQKADEEPTVADYLLCLPDDESLLREVIHGLPSEPETIGVTVDYAQVTGDWEDRRIEASSNADGKSSLRPNSSLAGRYRVLRFHAEGGLGEVHVAEDEELGREVALKQMKPNFVGNPDSLARFVLEGEVTGSLEHPGIVPVYGCGVQADGRPFYAMRFIRGETLAVAIAGFHSKTPSRFDSMEFRQLLGRFVAVCQAIAYAHSRGVLHRDLKPLNIMIGPFGETLILDWGLAKVIGQAGSADRAEADAGLREMAPGSAETMGPVGTPAYMSPEAAASRPDELGLATDIYGLGATLYELITGLAPFRGKQQEVLAQVIAGSWLPPTELNRAVPPALDAVCRKAMALRPQDRYAWALDLAKELESWLADEPVKAYREPRGARVRRWARKHPSRVTGAVVLLATAVIGLTLGAVLLERSRRQADESYKMAREAAKDFLLRVSEDPRMEEPGMLDLRLDLLSGAADHLQKCVDLRPDDREVLEDQAETHRLLGGLEIERGHISMGEDELAYAVILYEKLLRGNPKDEELRCGLAWCWLSQAELQLKTDQVSESGMATVNRAIDLLVTVKKSIPGHQVALYLLGRCYDLRAMAEARRGDMAAAIHDNLEARASLDDGTNASSFARPPVPGGMLPANPNNKGARVSSADRGSYSMAIGITSHVRLVAPIIANKGAILEATGQTAECARAFQEAADAYGWLLELYPRSSRFQLGLALALFGSGRAETELGRPVEGERDLRIAIAVLKRLVEQESVVPEYKARGIRATQPLTQFKEQKSLVPEYKVSLFRAQGFLGECLIVRGRHQAAVALLRDAIALEGDMTGSLGQNRPLLPERPRFLFDLGRLEAELGHHHEALRCFQEAAQLQEKVLAVAPDNPWVSGELLRTREAISALRLQKGEIGRDERIREQRQILTERENLAGRNPLSPQLRNEAGASAAVLSGLLLQGGQAREALEVVEKAISRHEALIQSDLQRGTEGKKQSQASQPLNPHPVGPFLSAGIWPRPAVPPSFKYQSQWAELLAHKIAALAATGQAAAAREVIGKAVAIDEEMSRGKCCYFCPPDSWLSIWSALALELYRQNPEPCHSLNLASHLALASTLPGGNRESADRAVQALRDLVASGFDNPNALQNDERLAALRVRPDFQDILRKMQTPAERPVAPWQK